MHHADVTVRPQDAPDIPVGVAIRHRWRADDGLVATEQRWGAPRGRDAAMLVSIRMTAVVG